MEFLQNVRTFKNFEDIAAEYESGELHPGDLKKGLMNALNKILQVSKLPYVTASRVPNDDTSKKKKQLFGKPFSSLDSTTESLPHLPILQPVRDHFKTDARAKNLLKQIKVIKTYIFLVLLIIQLMHHCLQIHKNLSLL